MSVYSPLRPLESSQELRDSSQKKLATAIITKETTIPPFTVDLRRIARVDHDPDLLGFPVPFEVNVLLPGKGMD